jgi:regulator of protease activity HflC (stomatin/prohibitin superfamily)
MAIGFIVGIILAVVAVVCVVGAFVSYDNDSGVGTGICSVVAVIAIIAFFIVPFSFHTVDTGEVAVVKHLGEAREVKEAGTHYNLWITDKYIKYDTKVRTLDLTLMAYSSDAQTMDITMSVQYQIMKDKALDISKQYGTIEALENRITAISMEKTKSAMSAYKAMDIIAQRAEMSPMVEDIIQNAIGEEYYVNVIAVALTNIDFSDAFEKAVEDKMIAEQAKLKADYENETKIAKAEAEAEAKRKTAEANVKIAEEEAKALLVRAEAEAEANRIIAESITQEILDKIYAERWNGELPKVVGSGEIILPSDLIK